MRDKVGVEPLFPHRAFAKRQPFRIAYGGELLLDRVSPSIALRGLEGASPPQVELLKPRLNPEERRLGDIVLVERDARVRSTRLKIALRKAASDRVVVGVVVNHIHGVPFKGPELLVDGVTNLIRSLGVGDLTRFGIGSDAFG